MWFLEQFKGKGEDVESNALFISNSSAWDSTMYELIGRRNTCV